METKSKWIRAQGPEEFEILSSLSLRAKKRLVSTFDHVNFNYPCVKFALRKVYTAVLKTRSSKDAKIGVQL